MDAVSCVPQTPPLPSGETQMGFADCGGLPTVEGSPKTVPRVMRVGGARAPSQLMKRKRHTPEEIIKKLREAGGMLAAGKNVEDVCRALGVSVATYQRWKSHYGGVKKDALKRLRELEKENARLKRAVADLTLDKAILKEIAEGKW